MKGDPEERAVQIGRYLVQSGATVRAASSAQAQVESRQTGPWQRVVTNWPDGGPFMKRGSPVRGTGEPAVNG